MKKHLYINGDWKSVNTYKPLYAPYSEETLAEIAQGTEEDVKEAVTAAKNAMKEMNTLSAYDRATILEKVAQKIQVFLNILMNSIDALESMKEERKIIIDVFEEDQSIRIVIKNNGPMIPAENVETIFEPFVTTKKLGTGIGLFVCKQIVEKHNGSIMCRSDNDWTEFQIAFQK
ncbi:sensor histidine kinase (sporulation kinase A) [Bacillus cereus Q1]|uniref:histidine kinase n=1 Tax=Bacillus cereus (strain Q1) TaxID=361100 RepID=B9IZU1_BACCQ|nr:sensor histidine kinase (sporulation kinase A) [Bacillus cereus Q1]